MKKIGNLNKFKNHELKNNSLTAIIGGTKITTTFKNGSTCCDNFDDSSKNAAGGWPSDDLHACL